MSYYKNGVKLSKTLITDFTDIYYKSDWQTLVPRTNVENVMKL
jgi:hypothetical protein